MERLMLRLFGMAAMAIVTVIVARAITGVIAEMFAQLGARLPGT